MSTTIRHKGTHLGPNDSINCIPALIEQPLKVSWTSPNVELPRIQEATGE